MLKGSGWYVTDYPSAERKKAMDAKKKPAVSKDKKSDKKTSSAKKEAAKVK